MAATVYRVPVRVGQHVQIGDALAELADLSHVRVRAFIDEPELGSVGVGQAVLVTWEALPGRSWPVAPFRSRSLSWRAGGAA